MPKAALALIASLVLSGCSPCFGVIDCVQGSHAAVTGRVLVGESGEPVVGARMTLVSLDAIGAVDSAVVLTTSDGLFDVSIPHVVEPLRRLSLRVAAPGLPGYVIDSVPCDAVRIRGDACVLNPIVPAPWVPYYGYFYYRTSGNAPVQSATVTFTRKAGATWFGTNASEVLVTRTDAGGVAVLLPQQLYTTTLDSVVGDLVVDLAPPYEPSVIRDFVIRPSYTFVDRPVVVLEVGPSLGYLLAFEDSASSKPLEGVQVNFRRTSGIAIAPDTLRAGSDTAGKARINVRPLGTGSVRGDLTVTPPGKSTTTFNGFSMPTFDNDSLLVFARWRVGKTGTLYQIPPGSVR